MTAQFGQTTDRSVKMEVEMRIRVFTLGNSEAQYVDLPSGGTIQDALDGLDINTSGITVTLKGAPAEFGKVLEHRDTLTVGTKVAGGLS